MIDGLSVDSFSQSVSDQCYQVNTFGTPRNQLINEWDYTDYRHIIIR